MKLHYPILISGFIGSGKSTLAKKLAKHYRMKYVSASSIHHKLVLDRMQKEKKNAKNIQDGFWESEAGKKGTAMRAKDLNIDKEVDRRLLKTLHAKPRAVTDARLMPWLYKQKAIRIWLSAPENTRAKRVGERDHLPTKKVLSSIRSRMKTDRGIFWKLYKIDMGKDFTPFDLVINNDKIETQQTFRIVKTYIDAHASAFE